MVTILWRRMVGLVGGSKWLINEDGREEIKGMVEGMAIGRLPTASPAVVPTVVRTYESIIWTLWLTMQSKIRTQTC